MSWSRLVSSSARCAGPLLVDECRSATRRGPTTRGDYFLPVPRVAGSVHRPLLKFTAGGASRECPDPNNRDSRRPVSSGAVGDMLEQLNDRAALSMGFAAAALEARRC